MSNVLNHIAVIPDGNRRYAKKYNLSLSEAYKIGAHKAEEFFSWSIDLGIKVITFFVLSTENIINRSKEEINILKELIKEFLNKIRESKLIHEKKVKVKVIGRKWMLPKDLQNEIKATEDLTKDYSNYYLNLAIAYGGRQEIIDGIKKLFEDMKKGIIDINNITENSFMKYLYFGNEVPYPEPDLIIRTGGENRISNFLLYEMAYSELYVLNKYWPEITKEDFLNAIEIYKNRERRFGR